jgi:phosphodiesterase/alkaline phosphatase D-like protein
MRKIVMLALVVSIGVAATAWAATTPAVVTGAATGVSNFGIVLHATVNPAGSPTRYNFQYGPTVAYGAYSRTDQTGHGTKAVPVTETLAGLTPGTLYHYRISASNRLGAALGRDRTFVTSGHPPPGAVTGVAVAVGKTTATLTGAVVTQDETTSFYFEFGPTPNYGMQTAPSNATAALTPTAISQALTGLAPGTTFHYRLVAQHAGVAPEYGADQAFTTIPVVRFGAKVTAHTTPGRARHKPYLFTTTGTVVPAVAFPVGYGCSGLVGIRYFAGHKAVAYRLAAVQSNCTFATQVGFRRRVDRKTARLRIVVRFRGNPYLRAASAPTKRVTLG